MPRRQETTTRRHYAFWFFVFGLSLLLVLLELFSIFISSNRLTSEMLVHRISHSSYSTPHTHNRNGATTRIQKSGTSATQANELEKAVLLRIEEYCGSAQQHHFPKLIASDNQSVTMTNVGLPFPQIKSEGVKVITMG